MRRSRLAALLLALSAVASATEVSGIKLDDRITLGTSELVLNGAGLRKKVFFKIYVVGLYLTERRKSPVHVFALAGPKRLSTTWLRTIPAQKLVEALTDGIHNNTSLKEQNEIRSRVEGLAANLMSLREVKEGDVIAFDWMPDAGTLVLQNGVVKGQAIPGEDVYRAVLKVWLGEHPTSFGLRKSLLGLEP